MSGNRTRKEDMWAQSSSTTVTENRTPSSPSKSTPGSSPAKSNEDSSVATNDDANSTKASLTPTSIGTHSHPGSGISTPDAEGLPQMPNVSRVSEYADGYEGAREGLSMLGDSHQEHADALTRALSVISLHGDTTPRALKTLEAMPTN